MKGGLVTHLGCTHCFPALCLMPFSAFRGFCVHQSVLKGEWRSRGSSPVLVVCCHCGQVPPPPCLHFSLQPRTTQRLPITSWSPPPPNPPHPLHGNFLWARQSGLSWPGPTGNSRTRERWAWTATKMAITSSQGVRLGLSQQEASAEQSGLLFVFLCLHF